MAKINYKSGFSKFSKFLSWTAFIISCSAISYPAFSSGNLFNAIKAIWNNIWWVIIPTVLPWIFYGTGCWITDGFHWSGNPTLEFIELTEVIIRKKRFSEILKFPMYLLMYLLLFPVYVLIADIVNPLIEPLIKNTDSIWYMRFVYLVIVLAAVLVCSYFLKKGNRKQRLEKAYYNFTSCAAIMVAWEVLVLCKEVIKYILIHKGLYGIWGYIWAHNSRDIIFVIIAYIFFAIGLKLHGRFE